MYMYISEVHMSLKITSLRKILGCNPEWMQCAANYKVDRLRFSNTEYIKNIQYNIQNDFGGGDIIIAYMNWYQHFKMKQLAN